ncbi:MAG: alpha/beta hydrolase [Anaerolineales bacterium]
MKLDFSKRNMDVATFPFRFMRALTVVGAGGAEENECFLALEKTKNNNDQSWIREWAALAERVAQLAEKAMQAGQTITARQAYMRACTYYQVAMFSLSPTDKRLFEYLGVSRELFHKAAKLFSPQIEVVDIPFGNYRLPAYFVSGGKAKQPTLLVINGGDSTNEEMFNWLGAAATERGWNLLVFEGPGQWSALQLNPGMTLRVEYEEPVKAVIDYLLKRDDVDPSKIALYGLSMSSLLAARVAAFEKRICACVINGGPVVDINQAWEAVRPAWVRKTIPGIWDFLFGILAKVNSQFGGFVNHFYWSFGVSTLRELVNAWKPFNITGLAPRIHCPILILEGEAEYAQTDAKTTWLALQFISELTCPTTIYEFEIEKDGWAASHCQVGGASQANIVLFDWLDKTVNKKNSMLIESSKLDWSVLKRHHHDKELEVILHNMPRNVTSSKRIA